MADLGALLDWRPRTPFYYGWLILGVAALGAFAASGGTQIALGGIQGFILEDTGWTKSTVAFAATLGTWSGGLVTPFVGRLTDRYGPRWLMPVGVIAAGASFLVLSGVDATWQFYAAYILGRAISQSTLVGVVPTTAAVNFFRRRRNIALSLNSMSRPVGVSINVQIISLIATRFGWRAGYRYLGVLSFLLVLPVVIVMRRRPEDIGLLPDGAEPQAAKPVSSTGPEQSLTTPGSDEQSWSVTEAVHVRAFWLVAGAGLLLSLGSATITFSTVPYLMEQVEMSSVQASGVLSVSIILGVSNFGFALLADRVTPRRCFIGAVVGAAAVVLLMLTIRSLPMAYAFGVLWGPFTGIYVLEQMILAQYFGRGSYGTISGVLGPFQTGAHGLGPIIGAVVSDATGSYKGAIAAVAGAFLLAALLIFFARPPVHPSQLRSQSARSQA